MASAPAFAATNQGTTLSMVATAYGPTAQDNYPYGATDYFGQPLTAGDIAVDPSVIPLKTCLYVTGYSSQYLPSGGEIGEADDEGGAIQGDRVDLYYSGTESQINQFGIQDVKVTILGKPTDPSASGTAACAGYENTVGQGAGQTSQATGGSQSAQGQGSGTATQSGQGASTGASSQKPASPSSTSQSSGSSASSGKGTSGSRGTGRGSRARKGKAGRRWRFRRQGKWRGRDHRHDWTHGSEKAEARTRNQR